MQLSAAMALNLKEDDFDVKLSAEMVMMYVHVFGIINHFTICFAFTLFVRSYKFSDNIKMYSIHIILEVVVLCHLIISGILHVLVMDGFSRKEVGIFFDIE